MSLEKTARNLEIAKQSRRFGGPFSIRQLQRQFGFKSEKSISVILDRHQIRMAKQKKSTKRA